MSLTLDLLRHGEPLGGPRYRGQTDDALSGRGWLQMHRAVRAQSTQHLPWQGVYSSPLRRCRDFARQISQRQHLPLHIIPHMGEIDFGRWEGRTAAQLMREDGEALGNFWRDPVQHTPHGGETLLAFRTRIITAWQQLLDNLQDDAAATPRHLLMISHGGVIRILLHHMLDIPLLKLHHIEVPYGCLTRIRIDWHDGEASARLASHGSPQP